MVTKEQYDEAVKLKDQLQAVINEYHREQQEAFDKRLLDNPIFTDEDLTYSSNALCPCGYGLAYPNGCGVHHYWDCSAILKGIADKTQKHCDQLPFSVYAVTSENGTLTTRGVFNPRTARIY